MDEIEKQKRNQLRVIKKDGETKDKGYLKRQINSLFRTHPKSFNRISKSLLENLAKDEHKIASKSLS